MNFAHSHANQQISKTRIAIERISYVYFYVQTLVIATREHVGNFWIYNHKKSSNSIYKTNTRMLLPMLQTNTLRTNFLSFWLMVVWWCGGVVTLPFVCRWQKFQVWRRVWLGTNIHWIVLLYSKVSSSLSFFSILIIHI